MNCSDFRRRAQVEPEHLDEPMRAHEQSCPGCRREAARARELDERLRAAFEMPVPEGLEARILRELELHAPLPGHSGARHASPGAGTSGSHPGAMPLTRRRLLGLAAGVAVTGGITGALLHAALERPGGSVQPPETDLRRAVVDHIQEHMLALSATGTVAEAELGWVLAPFGLRLRKSMDGVRYAGICDYRIERAPHLVVAGEKAPVTVAIMASHGARAMEPFSDRFTRGLVLPVHRGSVVLVGVEGEPLERTAARLLPAIDWSGWAV